MMIVATYDVDTSSPDGARRLRQVAKICENYGCRVQKSVFELLVEPAQYMAIKASLSTAIDMERDSVRFYRLGSNWRSRIESLGRPLRFEQDGALLF